MLGYAAMNRTLRERDDPVRCNRGMQKATWEERGVSYVGELAAKNFTDLLEILRWNREHGIYCYRCTSALIPWNSQFELSALPNFEEIEELARRCGELVEAAGMRLTFHPDYWCKLASDSPETVERSCTAIEYHADWLDLMGLPASPYYGINVHIGATYGDKAATASRFCEAVDSLSPSARARLTVENDDKESLWSVSELVSSVSEVVGVPVVFDYLHHAFTDRGDTYRAGFELAAETWGDVRPMAHYSEPARLRDGESRPQAHAAYVADLPDWLRAEADVMVEAGQKERAVQRLQRDDTSS